MTGRRRHERGGAAGAAANIVDDRRRGGGYTYGIDHCGAPGAHAACAAGAAADDVLDAAAVRAAVRVGACKQAERVEREAQRRGEGGLHAVPVERGEAGGEVQQGVERVEGCEHSLGEGGPADETGGHGCVSVCVCLYVCLCVSVCLYVYMSVCLYVCMSVWLAVRGRCSL